MLRQNQSDPLYASNFKIQSGNLYYFANKYSKKPLCRMFFLMCEKYAGIISGNETTVKIQILG